MISVDLEGKTVNLDDEGYLANFDDWNEKVACMLADREGVSKECPLTPERMEILKFIREHYRKFGAVPIVHSVCKNVHQPRDCQIEKFLDPLRAAKVAGLPKLETGYSLA